MVTSWSLEENHCLLDAERVLRIGIVRRVGSRALEIAEGGAAPRVEQRLDGGVGVLRRVMNLRDVVHRRDAVIELAERAEQLVDVDVLRPVDRGELVENEFEVGRAPARRAGAVVDQNPVGEEAAQRGLELVVVRIDEAGHDDAPARVDHVGAARRQVRPDGKDGLALDQDVGLGEVAHFRVHRHHRTAANDVAPARPAAVLRRVGRLANCAAAGRGANRLTPAAATPAAAAPLRKSRREPKRFFTSLVAKFAHLCVSPHEPFVSMALRAY